MRVLILLSLLISLPFLHAIDYFFDIDLYDFTFKGKALPALSIAPNAMPPPIHVSNGEQLRVNVKTSRAVRDMSIHWHGFAMKGKQAYDGVVGVTQCTIVPLTNFSYDFKVDEVPGTYWYHTHSGIHSGQWHDFMAGPLIVHKGAVPAQAYATPYSYGHERVLFISDIFKETPGIGMHGSAGGLHEFSTRGLAGDVIGTHAWWGALINGFESETEGTAVNVEVGRTYRLRLINGGEVFGFNFSIPGIFLNVVASDGAELPCIEPIRVDSVFLWPGERFDVEITIDERMQNKTLSIQIETLESARQGYHHYVRGFLRIGAGAPYSVSEDFKGLVLPEDLVVFNCYTAQLDRNLYPRGTCLSFASLLENDKCDPYSSSLSATDDFEEASVAIDSDKTDVHFFDFLFIPAPQYGHFSALDKGPYYQHTNPYIPLIDSRYSDDIQIAHGSSLILDFELNRTALLILRTSNIMFHPMHFHGHKFEVLDQWSRNPVEDCSIFACTLTERYDKKKIEELKNMPYTGLLKDTVTLPAGGSVAIRFPTDNPGSWVAHCHINLHKDDGMAFIIREGGDQLSRSAVLPPDYPECPHPDTQMLYPTCNCLHDTDVVREIQLFSDWKCSRDWLCHHNRTLFPEKDFVPTKTRGIAFHHYSTKTGTVVATFFSLAAVLIIVLYLTGSCSWCENSGKLGTMQIECKNTGSFLSCATCTFATEFSAEWAITHKDMINPMRFVEVIGLAALTGIVFYQVGEDTTFRGLRECVSMLFFSVTLWTFTRMYPAIPAHHMWRERIAARLLVPTELVEPMGGANPMHDDMDDDKIMLASKKIVMPTFGTVATLSLVRAAVYFCAESWWPVLFGLIAYPIAHLNGHVNIWFQNIAFIALNNLCYISFGSVLGTGIPQIQVGMISSTLYSQMSLVCAGFYRTLPIWLSWFKYVSYVYYTYSGIVKGVYRSSDSFTCRPGDGRVGQDWCLIETSGIIEDMQLRGINAADSSDPSSSDVSFNIGMLFAFYFINVLLLMTALYIQVYLKYKQGLRTSNQMSSTDIEMTGVSSYISSGKSLSACLRDEEELDSSEHLNSNGVQVST